MDDRNFTSLPESKRKWASDKINKWVKPVTGQQICGQDIKFSNKWNKHLSS